MTPQAIRGYIQSLDTASKTSLLEHIENRRTATRFLGNNYNKPLLEWVKGLLSNTVVTYPYARGGFHRSGRVRVIV